ncbi:MAG: hypothetical protein JNK82_25090 [Myxococcaceae bacterium]|nr:hypothetical protein [Myxococcaceae bacterium]
MSALLALFLAAAPASTFQRAGSFEVKSGRLRVGDLPYAGGDDLEPSGGGAVDVKKGVRRAAVDVGEVEPEGHAARELLIVHVSTATSLELRWGRADFGVLNVSGFIEMVDASRSREGALVNKALKVAIVPGGVVAKSHGDARYVVQLGKNTAGEVVAVRITFAASAESDAAWAARARAAFVAQ